MPPGDEPASATASACPTAPIVTVAPYDDPGVFSGLEGQNVDVWTKLYEHASANNRPDLSSAACDTSKLCNHNKTDECGPGCQCALIIDGSSTNIIQYRCSDTSLRTK
ncbi:uncharacterized protein LOC142574037 isoform X1 [Dermacentor variabilis]|uniref:uncharacterized protein LOC142574037 isoform X1 n=1 Tax=Dermacentor variabilis TaxID=34621 RepID=UPI003F5C1F63